MSDSKKDVKIVPSVEAEYGPMALPFHSAEKPFKSSALRNGAFKALQDAAEKGLTMEEWVEAAEALGSTKGAVKFILRAKRRVKVVKLPNDRLVVLGPTADGGELKLSKKGMPLKPRKNAVKK